MMNDGCGWMEVGGYEWRVNAIERQSMKAKVEGRFSRIQQEQERTKKCKSNGIDGREEMKVELSRGINLRCHYLH